MQNKINEKQNIEITAMKKDIEFIKSEMSAIKKQVFNDLPHKICQLSRDFNNFKISQMKWTISILVSVLFLLIATIINLLK